MIMKRCNFAEVDGLNASLLL